VQPFKEYKRKTIAEREDDYKARWRKRKFSPPRVDAFSNSNKGSTAASASYSYRDAMLEVQLEKERADIIRKIEQKKKEEKEEREAQERLRKQEKKSKKKKKDKRSRSNSPSASKWDEGDTRWRLDVFKNHEKINQVQLEKDTTLTIGRSDSADMRLDHGSISKNHAKLALFKNVYPSILFSCFHPHYLHVIFIHTIYSCDSSTLFICDAFIHTTCHSSPSINPFSLYVFNSHSLYVSIYIHSMYLFTSYLYTCSHSFDLYLIHCILSE
jgi:hypothetical protein